MSKFIRICRKNAGGTTILEGVRARFYKDKKSNKISLRLSLGQNIQKHLDLKGKDKLLVGYAEDNPYELELVKPNSNDMDGFTLSAPSGQSLIIKLPWDVSSPPEEAYTHPQNVEYRLMRDSVILNLIFCHS